MSEDLQVKPIIVQSPLSVSYNRETGELAIGWPSLHPTALFRLELRFRAQAARQLSDAIHAIEIDLDGQIGLPTTTHSAQ